MARKESRTKSKQKTVHQETLKPDYQTNYLLIGLVLLFVSILTFFDGGFVGVLFANAFRLIVGESYTLILFSIVLWAGYLVIKGRLPQIRWYKYLGAILIIISITTVLHFNAFNGIEPSKIFQRTYEVFRNDLVNNQTRANLGGGLLGASFYAMFGYLFGRWGTYLFSAIIFITGFSMVQSFSVSMLMEVIKQCFNSIVFLAKKLFPNFNEMKEVFNQSDDEGMDQYFEEAGENFTQRITNEESPSVEPIVQTPKTPKASLIDRLFRGDDKNNQIDQEHVQNEYQPIFQPNEHRYFKTFKREENPVIHRIVREEKILDLDYFDQTQRTNQTPTIHPENKQANSSVSYADAHSTLTDQPIHADEKQSHQLASDTTDSFIQSAEELRLENEPMEVSVAFDRHEEVNTTDPTGHLSAGHWQNQATNKQDLTSDEIEDVLAQGEEQVESKVAKPSKRSQTYQLPGKQLLKKIPPVDQSEEYARINDNIQKLERTFDSFGVKAKVVQANLGPSVTKYEIEPAIGVKVSKIVSLSDDIALALAARDIRMEAPIPGKSLIGIEVPNTQVSPVSFWEIIDAALESSNLLEVPLGRDISGSVCLADLSKMPHLLIAGATGSGKSVGMNVIIVSLLMKAHPDDVKFLMIDPKKVELTMYDDLPHQLAPVVTNPRKAAQALNKVVQEMERRYELFAASNVRNIDSYNEQVETWNQESTDTVYEKLPKIIVFVDELADLMMVASNEVENAIIRLAQMARAAGIHMIIATQRPSVDVITGIIKANVPSRLAFAVSSGTDSRTILDSVGAEKLLGRGDMLFQPMGKNKPVRVQGAYISDSEVEKITDFIKDQRIADYEDSLINLDEESDTNGAVSEDEYFEEAVEMLQGLETISISQLQRKFRIGYNRAARLIDDMEQAGLVSAQDGSKPRQVL